MEDHQRISRQTMFMDMAEVAAKRSSCCRGNVGCVITHDGNILAIGYNGPQAGDRHCSGASCELNATGGCSRSIHAEINALNRLGSFSAPIRTKYDLYSTVSPCADCAEAIAHDRRIVRVFYRHPYRDDSGLNELLSYGVAVYKVTAAGMIVNHQTRQLISAEQLR